jgi:dTDP-glucose 4,6-dehydratase
VDYLLNKNYKIYGFSRSLEPSKLLLKYKYNKKIKNFKFIKFNINYDLNFLNKFIKKNKVDYIVDFLGQGMVAESWINPDHWYKTNILSKVKMYDLLSKNKKFKKYIRISTPEAIGYVKGLISETTKSNPSTPYAISHLTQDLTLLAYFKFNKFPFVISRFSNFYGPHQQPYRIIPKTLYCIFNKKKLSLHGGGKAIRSFIYIDDFCDGIYKSMTKGKPGEVYNFTNREYVSIVWLIKKICFLTKANFNKLVKISKDRPTKDPSYKMNPRKAEKNLNWKPKYSIEEGLKNTIDWYKTNKNKTSILRKVYVHKP